MASAAVVGAFDPGDDRDPQLVTGGPGTPVENIVLQQREEAFHRGVVTRRTHPAHRAGQAVACERADEFPGAKLRSAVGVHHAASDGVTAGDGVGERGDGEAVA